MLVLLSVLVNDHIKAIDICNRIIIGNYEADVGVGCFKVSKVKFDVQWNGNGEFPHPAYFALDDISVVE